MSGVINRKSVKFAGEPINLSELSRATGISTPHLSRIFSGGRQPSLGTLCTLLEALDMSADAFLEALPSRN